ncbi:hypothetical protein AGR4B_pAt10025 [Agrobacterium tumefaciens str. CFBP 5621]|nr:hypothetical protein AGR4B_pAt10025 [Agrobacterium tumefaciens str. CFBP 5621]
MAAFHGPDQRHLARYPSLLVRLTQKLRAINEAPNDLDSQP